MKKAKIFLTALTVLAIAGGALAFKARVPKMFAYCNIANQKCELEPFASFETTTLFGGNLAPYAPYGDNCAFSNGQWTCTTRVTVSQ